MWYVKSEMAERFAATAVDDVCLEKTRVIIREYLRMLTICPMCEGQGEFTFKTGMHLKVRQGGGGSVQEVEIARGAVGSCPRCGGLDADGIGGHDPEHVAWHCTDGQGDGACQNSRKADEPARDRHAKCGYRVMLPIQPSTHGTSG